MTTIYMMINVRDWKMHKMDGKHGVGRQGRRLDFMRHEMNRGGHDTQGSRPTEHARY